MKVNNRMYKWLCAGLALLLLLFAVGCQSQTANGQARKTTILGGGQDVYTIMVYMCASDLESENGMATDDLNEMLSADIGENVNILVETGGANTWHFDGISNETNQRYKVESGELVLLEDDLGAKNMADPDTLQDFIGYCQENFPANRYALIFWNHGGGAVGGFGYDELFQTKMMGIDQINNALSSAGVKFDFIGFDACLMATLETAYMLGHHADYMIASEELEPGTGWYYTDWLTALSEDTSLPTLDIATIIIDDFVDYSYHFSPTDQTTLSVLDLAEIENVYVALCSFMGETKQMLTQQKFDTISRARSNTKEFGENEYDLVDIVSMAANVGIDESQPLIDAVQSCVKYNRTSDNVKNAHGLTLYFPYNAIEYFDKILGTYRSVGLGEEYAAFYTSFVNLLVGGQGYVPGNDMFSTGEGWNEDYEADFGAWEDYGWFDMDAIEDYSAHYATLNYDELEVFEKNGYYALSLLDEDWDIITSIGMVVLYDDGEGYLDLGYDNVYEFDDDGDLMIDFDGTWFAVNGQIVSLYIVEEGDGFTKGLIPAILNGKSVNLVVVWDTQNPHGVILGAAPNYDGPIAARGLIDIKIGDEIQFTCDGYTYDEEYEDTYLLGESLVVSGTLELSYEWAGDGECLVYYVITDVYLNQYWTEPVIFS